MPVYLPPLTRRQFIARSFAAGAGLAFGSRLLAAATEPDPYTWVLLSDPHIAADRTKTARGINMAGQFETVVKDVLEQAGSAAGVVINGDLAFNTGETADYVTFTELVEPLRAARLPLYLALGNHDNRERFWAGLRNGPPARPPVVGRQVMIVRSPRANWFVLDSLDKTMSTPGVLGAPQLQWLAEALDAHADRPALVVIHHNPSPSGTKTALVETSELFEIIRPRRHVKAYFFGHTHCWSVTREDSGLCLINLPTTAYCFDQTQPAGWVNAQLEPMGVRLHLRCLDRGHAMHGTVSELVWRS